MIEEVGIAGAAAIAGLISSLLASVVASMEGKRKSRLERDLAKISSQRDYDKEELSKQIATSIEDSLKSKNPSKDVRDLIRLAAETTTNLILTREQTPTYEKLVSDYHEQALGQARVQFWFSVVMATFGFLLILYSGYTSISEQLAATSSSSGSLTASLLKLLPGTIIEAVAVLFFKQSAETRSRANELYDRLRTDKLVIESIALVNSIENGASRDQIKSIISLHMAGLSTGAGNLTEKLLANVSLVAKEQSNGVNSKKEKQPPA